MSTILYTDISRTMTGSLAKAAPRPQLFLQFFGNKEREDTEIVELDKKFKGVRVAQFVNPDAVADGSEKLAFDNYTFKLPTVQDSVPVTAKELKRRLFSDTVYAQKTPAAKAAVLVADIQSEQMDKVENAMELMAIDSCFNGTITVVGKGENRVIDFNRNAANTIDLLTGNYWDEAGGTPASDTDSFIELIGSDGSNATHIIGRVATMGVYVSKLESTDDFDSRRIDRGELVFESFADVNGAIFYGRYKGLEIWGFDGNYEDSDGAAQKAVPDKKIVVLSARNSNVDMAGYAADMDLDYPDIQGNTKAVIDNRNFISKVTKGKKTLDMEAIQTRAPMLIDANSTLVATVIST